MPRHELKTADESEIAAAIRRAIGVGPNDYAEVETPQFERVDDIEPSEPPLLESEFEALKTLSEDELREAGLQPWNEEHTLWLLPNEWYPHIPKGTELTDIMGETFEFERGEDNDQRYGALPYGIEVGDGYEYESSIERVDK